MNTLDFYSGLSDEEILRMAADALGYETINPGQYERESTSVDAYGSELLSFARAIIARCATPAPVPVAERPWEREGWCAPNGHCWLWDVVASRWIYRHYTAHRLVEVTVLMPHWALPLPESQP